MDLRKVSQGFRYNLNKFSFNFLRQAYEEVASELSKSYRPEVDRTFFEDVFYRLLKSHTKLQINRSFWIGKRNIDIFVPAIIAEPKGGIQRLKGLAIEIDGPIHNEEHKMRRDDSKFQMLDELSIGSVVIQNHSFDNPTVAKIIRDISSYRNPDFRSKRRLLRSIYIRTIIANKDLCSERNLYQSKSLLQALREI